jgi:hypothetical protein
METPMKKTRNVYSVDKVGTKHEKHHNTKRYPAGTDSASSKKSTASVSDKKQEASSDKK